ncbi:MFS transporter, UMF1 family [Malonomonas rubra DSM 5091]|uniref:MFS transporter, UMF1 family n=1 Tax=Malonomonas rubra DSM 5091 TaxID=1122189 RepID=A0A1M6B3X1_MALRU|nr:MFS transporter [Malonomonas rubra]SHI43396.1 MFS transporter, UMF1 family [Malonomonas rubra DSM 5091]
MKRENRKVEFGWCMYDWANSAFATVVLAAVLPVYFVSLVPQDGASLPFLTSHKFSASSLWGYSISLSMLIIAVLAPALGTLADRKGWHKSMLWWFCLLGCSATVLLGFTGSGDYFFAATLFVLGNIGFAGSNVLYNSYLPLLVSGEQTDRLSARGFAYGYIGGGLLLALVFLLISKHQSFGFSDAAQATRFGFMLTGVWWLMFSLPTFYFLPKTDKATINGDSFSLKEYFSLFKELAGYRDLCIFLLAFLCYNDGIQTVISVSAIFAREELQLGQATIIGCFLMIQFLAMPGALLFGRLAGKMGTANAILLSLVIFTLVCVFAYRMTGALEFWLLGGVIAIILGGSQALSRSLYASMVPKHKSAEFFGFFTISSRFASIFGPLLFALIADLTGSSRNSILALGSFFILGGMLLLLVNVKRARTLAEAANN